MLSAVHVKGAIFLAAAFLFSCEKEEAASGPEDVMAEFVAKMRQVHGSTEAGERAFDLMWKPARDNLRERARRASALSGRELAPGELVVPSWFALYVQPDHMDARIDGEWAEVTVFDSAGKSVVTRCKLEEDGWKVALELPPLAAIRHREVPDE